MNSELSHRTFLRYVFKEVQKFLSSLFKVSEGQYYEKGENMKKLNRLHIGKLPA